MRRTILAIALALPTFAQSNITIRANYATEQAVCYDAVDDSTTPYTVIVATDAGLTNVINDFNSALFSGANVDLTRTDTAIEGGTSHTRCIQIGHTLGIAGDGKTYPRPTPANTILYYSINGVMGSYTTTNAPLGQSYGHSLLPDPNVAGSTWQPYLSWTNRNERIYDWATGVQLARIHMPGDYTHTTELTQASSSGSLGTWLVSGYSKIASGGDFFFQTPGVNSYAALLKSASCTANCAAAGARDVEVEISYDGVNFSNPVTATLGTSPADQMVYPDGTSTPTMGVPFPGLNMVAQDALTWQPEYLTTSGLSTTVMLSGTAICANVHDGSRIQLYNTTAHVISRDCVSTPNTMVLDTSFDIPTPAGFGVATGWIENTALAIRVRQKNPGTGSTLSIASVDFMIDAGGNPGGASGGFIDHCQTPTYMGLHTHLCLWGMALYSWDDQTNQVLLVGSTAFNRSCGGVSFDQWSVIGADNGGVPWDNAVSGLMYGGAIVGGQFVIVKLQFTGDPTISIPRIDADSPWSSQFANTCSVLTPTASGNNLNALVAAYDPNWTSDYQSNFNFGVEAVSSTGKIITVARRGIQDTNSYIAVFDPGNGLPLGSGGTGSIIAGNFSYKFANIPSVNLSNSMGGTHTFFNCDDCGNVFAWQPSGKKGDGGPGTQKFYTTILDHCADAVQPADPAMCSSWVSGLPPQATGTQTWIHVTSAWNPAWGTQPAGYTTGDLLTTCPTATCLTIDHWLNGYRVGDFFARDYYNINEVLKITAIGALDGTGRPLMVQRKMFDDGSVCFSDPTPCTWNSGDQLYGQGEGSSGVIWDFGVSPDGTNPAAFHITSLPGGGHQSIKNAFMAAAATFLGYISGSIASAPTLMDQNDPTRAFAIPLPETFAGITSNGQPDCQEGHPGDPYVWGSGSAARSMAPDVNPMEGSTCFNAATGATLVSWPIYKFATTNIHPKQFDTLATVGSYLLKNISGPGSLLTTATSDWWKTCTVLIAGECYAGSAIGEIYFSAPNLYFTESTSATPSLQDTTIGDVTGTLQAVTQNFFPAPSNYTDPGVATYSGLRRMMVTGKAYKAVGNTDNCEALPGGTLVACGTSFSPNIPRVFSLAPIPLAYPIYDGVDRTTFVPKTLSISSVPMGTAKVQVKFGYNENLECSQNRTEACYAVVSAIVDATPYKWASELVNGDGVSCASACNVPLPSIYGEVLQMQVVYLDSMGSIISTGPRLMEAADSAPSTSGISRRGPQRSAGPRISR